MPLIAGVVCTAFSIELFLKFIISEKSNPPRWHNLEALFNMLPPQTQEEVIGAMPSRESFHRSLKKVAKVFEEWRYVYEIGASFGVDLGFLRKLSDVLYVIAHRDPLVPGEPSNSPKHPV